MAINPNELRIGNYVQRRLFNPDKIVTLYPMEINDFYWFEESGRDEDYWDNFKFIQITDEILIRFGFENWGLKKVNEYEQETTYALYNSLDGTSTFKLVLIDSWYGANSHKEWVVRVDHETIHFHRMQFVHDLQNAFYLLSGYELILQERGEKV